MLLNYLVASEAMVGLPVAQGANKFMTQSDLVRFNTNNVKIYISKSLDIF